MSDSRIAIVYSVEDLLHLRNSPLVQKPEGLPPIESWISSQPSSKPAPPASNGLASSSKLSFGNGIKPAFSSKGSSDAFVLTEGVPAAARTRATHQQSPAMTTRTWRADPQEAYSSSSRDKDSTHTSKPKSQSSRLDGLSHAFLNARTTNPKSRFGSLMDKPPASQRVAPQPREPVSREPEWITDDPPAPSSSRPTHTQEDFERWKERMHSSKNNPLPENEEEAVETEEQTENAPQTRPIPVSENAFQDLLVSSNSGMESAEGLQSKAKSSRFAHFFAGGASTPRAEPGISELPGSVPPPTQPPANQSTPGRRLGDGGEAEAFNRVITMLTKSKISGPNSNSNTPTENTPVPALSAISGNTNTAINSTDPLRSGSALQPQPQSRFFSKEQHSRGASLEGTPAPPTTVPQTGQPQGSTLFLLSLIQQTQAAHGIQTPKQNLSMPQQAQTPAQPVNQPISQASPAAEIHGVPLYGNKTTSQSYQTPVQSQHQPSRMTPVFSPGSNPTGTPDHVRGGMYDQLGPGIRHLPMGGPTMGSQTMNSQQIGTQMNSQQMGGQMGSQQMGPGMGVPMQYEEPGWANGMPPGMGPQGHGPPENVGHPPPNFPQLDGGMPPGYGPPNMMMFPNPQMGGMHGEPPSMMDSSRVNFNYGPNPGNAIGNPPMLHSVGPHNMGPMGFFPPPGPGPAGPPGFLGGPIPANIPAEYFVGRGASGGMGGGPPVHPNHQLMGNYPMPPPPDMVNGLPNGRYM